MTRKLQTVFQTAAIVLSLLLLFLLSTPFCLTPESAFRHLEKRFLLGPSEILDTHTMVSPDLNRILTAKNSDGYTLFVYNAEKSYKQGQVYYFPKDGSTTLVNPPFFRLFSFQQKLAMPVFAFTDKENAVSATFHFQITDGENDWRFDLTGEKTNHGYFIFWLNQDHIDLTQGYGVLRQALFQANITITLYDQYDQIIETKHTHFTELKY